MGPGITASLDHLQRQRQWWHGAEFILIHLLLIMVSFHRSCAGKRLVFYIVVVTKPPKPLLRLKILLVSSAQVDEHTELTNQPPGVTAHL